MDVVDRLTFIEFCHQHRQEVIDDWVSRNPINFLNESYEEWHAREAKERVDYCAKLFRASDEQLIGEVNRVQEEQEQARLFNQPHACADYELYGRMRYISRDEATALSLGRDPRVVSWATVKPYLEVSRFARVYRNRLELLERELQFNDAPDRIAPLDFLNWAHLMKLDVPDEFISATFDRGEPQKYWRDLCIETDEALVAAVAARDAARSELEQHLENASQQRQPTFQEWSGLNAEIEELKRKLADATSAEPALSPKTRTSLDKMIIGMALDSYGYDPRDVRSTVSEQLSKKLSRFEIVITGETVGKYLRAAAEQLDVAAIENELPKRNSGRNTKSV